MLTVYVYPDSQAEEMLDVVNSTSVYGLTGAIFSNDRYSAISSLRTPVIFWVYNFRKYSRCCVVVCSLYHCCSTSGISSRRPCQFWGTRLVTSTSMTSPLGLWWASSRLEVLEAQVSLLHCFRLFCIIYNYIYLCTFSQGSLFIIYTFTPVVNCSKKRPPIKPPWV